MNASLHQRRRRIRRVCRSLRLDRVTFIIALCVLVAGGCLPWMAIVSGALDRVIFDGAAKLLMPRNASHVAVINLDERSQLGLRARRDNHVTPGLLARLGSAGSVTLEFAVPAHENFEELSDAVATHGRVVLPMPIGLLGDSDQALPRQLVDFAAGSGHHRMITGHLGVISGFVPLLPGAINYRHVTLESMRVAGKTSSVRRGQGMGGDLLDRLATDAVLVLPELDSVPQYAMIDVIDGKVPPEAFSGKMVFVGRSAWRDVAFRTSSISERPVSLAQLDALMAEAVTSDGVVRLLSAPSAMVLHVLLALILVLICALGAGWQMHVSAALLFCATLAMPVAMLSMRWWVGLGVLPLAYALIYAYFAWENLRSVQRLWRREMEEMHSMSTLLGMSFPRPDVGHKRTRPLHEIRALLHEVRSWQRMALNMIDQLPHPVLVLCDRHVLLWNDSATRILAGAGDGAQPGVMARELQRVISEGRGHAGEHREIRFGGRDLLLLEVPFSMFGDAPTERGDATTTCTLVCLVDIASVKEGVTQSKLALRHMAHDMRSPLATMLALIEEQRGVVSHDGDPGFLEDLRRQADYSLRVAGEFLAISRAEQIRPRHFAPVVFKDLAAEAMDQCAAAAGCAGIALIGPEGSDEGWVIDGCPDMLVRAVVNVVDNAIKYSRSGTAVHVNIRIEDDSTCVLSVRDQGVGIESAHLDRLFEPFYRVTPAGPQAGVGLGLPFVQRVIEQHHGRVHVASKPGEGTCFELKVPCRVSVMPG